MRIGKNKMVVIDQGLEVKYRLGLGVHLLKNILLINSVRALIMSVSKS